MMCFSRTCFRLSAIAVLVFGLFSSASAQFHTLTTPGGDNYPLLRAAFGECAPDTYTGEWVIIEDATAPVTNGCEAIGDLTGKIALIDRGTCNFDVKCLNAQNAGAIAVVVCNNTTAAPAFIQMGNVSVAAQVNIPCFFARKADCDVLRVLTPLNITIAPDEDEVVVWGDEPGQGDFAGGLNGWEINNISCANGQTEFDLWQWTATGGVTGAFGSGTIVSRTACNGAMGFNSDFYDNNGSQAGAGTGPCTANQEGELISPTIDLSTTTVAGVTLEFRQLTRQFQSQYFVGYSVDNGANWTEIEINTEIEVNNDPALISTVRLPLPGVVGSSQVKIKFRYAANYYYWVIDDVRLIEQEANNMRVNSNFYAVAQNASTPLIMTEPIRFLADISNVGASPQTNVVLNMTIKDDADVTVFDEDLDYNTVQGNTIIENIPFDETFTPSATGGYTGTYSISADADDFDASDNELSFDFFVTDSIWAKELGQTRIVVPAAGNWTAGEAHSWGYGNHFYVPQLEDPAVATSISFAIDATQTSVAGQNILLALYQWTDTNEDGNAQDTERQLINFASYVIVGNETEDDIITVPFDGGASQALENNTHYILMLEFNSPNATTDLWLGASEAYDYGAMSFVTALQDNPRFGSMLAIGDLSTEAFSSTGFGTNIVPIVRMNVQKATSTKDPLSDNNLVAVYPNPVQEVLNLSYELEQTAQNLSIRIMDVTGKVVMERQYSQAKSDTINFNVKELAAGTYNVQLTSENGTTSRRFVVAK